MKILGIKRTISLLCIIVALTSLNGCTQLVNESQTVLGLLQKSTVYYLNDEATAQEELSSKRLYADLNDPEQAEYIEYNTNISIKDSGDLNISVDNMRYSMTVSSLVEGKAKEVYNVIINELTTNNEKYEALNYSILLDDSGNVSNIQFDENTQTITFDFSASGVVDTRILELYYTSYNTYKQRDNVKNSKNTFSIGDVEKDTDYVIFKHDAIYGIANNDEGDEALEKLKEIYGDKIIKLGETRIYKGINVDNTIETVESIIEYPRMQSLTIGSANYSGDGLKELSIYIEEDAIKFKEDLCEYLESAGFEPVITEKRRTSSLVIGYTWLYNNSIQSVSDDRLDYELKNHHNMSTIDDKSVEFLLRSSWGLR